MDKEQYNKLIEKIRESIGEEDSALLSEDFIALMSAFSEISDQIAMNIDEISKLKERNEELLKVNGSLFQKLGLQEEKKLEKETVDDGEVYVDDIIDEKGEYKNGE